MATKNMKNAWNMCANETVAACHFCILLFSWGSYLIYTILWNFQLRREICQTKATTKRRRSVNRLAILMPFFFAFWGRRVSHFIRIALLISFGIKMANETTFFEVKHTRMTWFAHLIFFTQFGREETSVVLVFFFVVFNTIVDKNFGSKARIGNSDTSMSYDKYTWDVTHPPIGFQVEN